MSANARTGRTDVARGARKRNPVNAKKAAAPLSGYPSLVTRRFEAKLRWLTGVSFRARVCKFRIVCEWRC